MVPCEIADLEKSVQIDMAQSKDKAGLKAQIDENLKRVYQETLDEKVPERFAQLLEQLRQKESDK